MNFVVIQSLSCVQQHTRLPCPSLSPGACSNSCPLRWQCHPTISPSVIPFSSCLQSFPASESALQISWPKYWSFSFSISPSNEYSRLISFEIGWFDLFAVLGTLKSLLQHHSSKSSVLRVSAFLWSNSHMHTWLLGGETSCERRLESLARGQIEKVLDKS